MSWDYRLEARALQDLRQLGPSTASEILGWLDYRIRGTADPRKLGKPLRGRLKGYWRYRIRDWRLLCRIEDRQLIVIVIAAGHRSSIYDD